MHTVADNLTYTGIQLLQRKINDEAYLLTNRWTVGSPVYKLHCQEFYENKGSIYYCTHTGYKYTYITVLLFMHARLSSTEPTIISQYKHHIVIYDPVVSYFRCDYINILWGHPVRFEVIWFLDH